MSKTFNHWYNYEDRRRLKRAERPPKPKVRKPKAKTRRKQP